MRQLRDLTLAIATVSALGVSAASFASNSGQMNFRANIHSPVTISVTELNFGVVAQQSRNSDSKHTVAPDNNAVTHDNTYTVDGSSVAASVINLTNMTKDATMSISGFPTDLDLGTSGKVKVKDFTAGEATVGEASAISGGVMTCKANSLGQCTVPIGATLNILQNYASDGADQTGNMVLTFTYQ